MHRARTAQTLFSCLLLSSGCSLVLDFSDYPDSAPRTDAPMSDASPQHDTAAIDAGVSLRCQAYEPNEDTGNAAAGEALVEAAICGPSDLDFYSFEVDGAQDLELSLAFETANGNLDLRLRDAAGAQLVQAVGNAEPETLVRSQGSGGRLAAGTYYVEVFSLIQDENDYDLSITITP